jgi:hypothetical protein
VRKITTPSEIQLAQRLLNVLQKATALSKQMRLSRITLSIDDAEQLVDLMADSLRTIDKYDLVEFDHTVPPPQKTKGLPCKL